MEKHHFVVILEVRLKMLSARQWTVAFTAAVQQPRIWPVLVPQIVMGLKPSVVLQGLWALSACAWWVLCVLFLAVHKLCNSRLNTDDCTITKYQEDWKSRLRREKGKLDFQSSRYLSLGMPIFAIIQSLILRVAIAQKTQKHSELYDAFCGAEGKWCFTGVLFFFKKQSLRNPVEDYIQSSPVSISLKKLVNGITWMKNISVILPRFCS